MNINEILQIFRALTRAPPHFSISSYAPGIKMYSGENKAFPYLIQRLSMAIQQGNATLIRGTLPSLTVDLFS